MIFAVGMCGLSTVMQLLPADAALQAYREFASAAAGDAARGKQIFHRQDVARAGCHSVGQGRLC